VVSYCDNHPHTFTYLVIIDHLLILESYVMLGGFWQALSPLLSCFMVLILLFITSMGDMWKGSRLLSQFQA
jgi:hypothetical protein